MSQVSPGKYSGSFSPCELLSDPPPLLLQYLGPSPGLLGGRCAFPWPRNRATQCLLSGGSPHLPSPWVESLWAVLLLANPLLAP